MRRTFSTQRPDGASRMRWVAILAGAVMLLAFGVGGEVSATTTTGTETGTVIGAAATASPSPEVPAGSIGCSSSGAHIDANPGYDDSDKVVAVGFVGFDYITCTGGSASSIVEQ